MVDRHRVAPCIRSDLLIGRRVRIWAIFADDQVTPDTRGYERLHILHSLYHCLDVVVVAQNVGVNQGLVEGVGRREGERATRERGEYGGKGGHEAATRGKGNWTKADKVVLVEDVDVSSTWAGRGVSVGLVSSRVGGELEEALNITRGDHVDTLTSRFPLRKAGLELIRVASEVVGCLSGVDLVVVSEEWMVGQVLANIRKVNDGVDSDLGERSLVANTREQENLRSTNGASSEDDLVLGLEREALAYCR